MKRVKCGNFWTDAGVMVQLSRDKLGDYEWIGSLYLSPKARKMQAGIASGRRFQTYGQAKADFDCFIAAANRDTSLPLNGTVS